MKERERFTILLEDMNDKIKVIADGVLTCSRQIQEGRDEARKENQEARALSEFYYKDLRNEMKEEIGKVKIDLSDKIDAVDKKLSDKIDEVDNRLSDKIDAVDKKLSDKIDSVKQELKETKRELGNKIDGIAIIIEDHSKRLEQLEGRVVFV